MAVDKKRKDRALYPVIYVRGYAGTQGEVEKTVATPYMGFNYGSTKLRQSYTGKIHPNVFESPLIRLMKDFEYRDAYHDGLTKPEGPVPARSVWIFRYYDVTSGDLGDKERKEIEFHAEELRKFILHVRDATADDWPQGVPFRVHLVAHSMGGLVCRCYLQNRKILTPDGAKATSWEDKWVDKLFTYATPHGGIEFRKGLGWIEGLRDFVDINNAGNFGEKRMRQFLDLEGDQLEKEALTSLAGRFPTERTFCVVGTDARDYAAVAGLSHFSVGPLSDGLVTIENAAVRGAPRAFVHRSHSGHYGIVNSESAFQNLTRFLFGNIRADGRLIVKEITLPADVQKKKDENKEVRASYHFETVIGVRGKRWNLHRRLVNEGSAVFRSYDELMKNDPPRYPHLFSTFLAMSQRTNRRRASVGFSIDLGVLVPEYEVDERWRPDNHYEGGYLFRDKINIDVIPEGEDGFAIRYGFDSRTPNRATKKIEGLETKTEGVFEFGIPIRGGNKPGIVAELRITCRPWNQDAPM